MVTHGAKGNPRSTLLRGSHAENYGIAQECAHLHHCSRCGAPGAHHELTDGNGAVVPFRYLCADCVSDAGDDLADVACASETEYNEN